MAVRSYSKSKEGNVKLSQHFAVWEFASPDSDVVKIDTDLIGILERLYAYLGCSKIVITSGYRTPAGDKKEGGTGSGYHTTGKAADINCWHVVNGKEVRYHGSEICCALQELGWKRGIGWIAGCAVHVDTRTSRYWFDEQNGCRSIGADWYSYMAGKGYRVDKPRLRGDVNGDGKVNTTDARQILQAAAGACELTEQQQAAADVNGDGKVNTADAREVLLQSAGK